MADKTIRFEFGDEGEKPQKGGSLVPAGSRDLTKEQEEQVQSFGELIDEQRVAYDEFVDFVRQWSDYFAREQFKEDDPDIIDGETVSGTGGGAGQPPNDDDPFRDAFDGPEGFGDWFRDWMDELSTDFRNFQDVLDRQNADYDELTEQADNLGTELVTVATVAGEVGLAFTALIGAAFAFNRAVDGMVEAVGGFSADVAEASARSRIQEIEDRLALAEQAGGDIASLERIRSDLASEIRQIMRELIEILTPFLEVIGQILVSIFNSIKRILELISYLSDLWETMWETLLDKVIIPVVGNTPLLGEVARRLLAWLKSDNDNKDSKTLNSRIDDLFK